MSQVQDFAALFRGRTDALGHAAGAPQVVERRAVTEQDYAEHLQGVGHGIGIYPMLDDNTVWFAAVDLDEPNFELARLMQKLIPGQSWVERSKSGNAHVWVFFERPAPAWAVRTVLRGATQGVGRPEVEVFPKQDQLRDEQALGNFINLPYHGEDRPILVDGDFVDDDANLDKYAFLEDFLRWANEGRQDPDAWVRRARALGGQPPEEREDTSEWGTQPRLHMCADYIMEHRFDNPLTPGHRAVVLFRVACQFLNWRDSTEAEVREWVHAINDAGERPAPAREVDRQIDNAIRGRFTSTGCDDPTFLPYAHPDCPIAHPERRS